ncbi:VOC family protein [Hyphobacterium sp. CCMP332]|nr:VOC family protein [Hyphobacterium sp. CCMP332]
MKRSIIFSHTNLIAKDWKRLAEFYIEVFDCVPTFPERDIKGKWIDDMCALEDVHLRGVHLQLPGFEKGPTLEIFEYNQKGRNKNIQINDFGFGHIAFHVEDVGAVLAKLIDNGGSMYGKVVEAEIPGKGFLKAFYARDPEGNIIEIQNWRVSHVD